MVRLANGNALAWRNNANTGDVALAKNTSDALTYNGNVLMTSAGAVPVTAGGTGLSSGNSGGIVYYSNSTTLASSATLTASQVLVGGGAGAAPTALAAGSQYQSLVMGASNPGYAAVNLAQSAAVTGILPNANTTATNVNTASAIVSRDGSGNFSAGTVTAALTGNVTGNLTGNVAGNVTGSVTGAASLNVLKAGDTMSGALNLGGNQINNVAAPSAGTDVCNKNYVDNKVNGISWRPEVNLFDNVDTTKPSGATATIDGVAVANGNRVLFTNLGASNNQVYVASGVGTSISWTLATDGQAGTGAPSTGDALLILSGTTYGQSCWDYNGTQWVQFNGANQVQAGTGLSKSGNTISLANPVTIALGGTGQATAIAAFDALSPLTTKGDLIAYSGTHNVRIPVGADGQVPVADATQANGLAWKTLQQGAKNYITYNNFENNSTTGWSLGNVPLTSNFPSGTPTFGSGASGNLAIGAINSGQQLAGSYSLSMASSTATTAGDFLASQAYTIDLEDQAKVLSFKFYYKPSSGASNCNFSGTSSNSFGVAIYDVANSAWIMPAGVWNLVQGSGVGIAQGTFQTPANMTSFRIVLFNANATAGAATLYLDDFYVGPQSLAFGPAISDLGAKPWTPTGTWSTNTTWTGFYKQEGDTGKFYARATLSGAPTGTFTVNLPPGLSMDTTKLGSATEELTLTGWCKVRQHTAGSYHINQVTHNGDTAVGVFITSTTTYTGNQYPKDGAGVTATIPFTFAANDYVEVYWEAPIVGWSSNTVMSADSDTRVVAWQGYTTSTQSVDGSLPQVTAWTTLNDTHGAFSNNSYVVQVSGYYRMSGGIYFGTNAGSNVPSLAAVYKNGVQIGFGPRNILNASQNTTASFSNTFKFVSGDVITIRAYAASATSLSAGASNGDGIWSIEKLSGPAVVAASESVNARLTNTAGTSVGTSATVIPFATVSFDSHSTWNQSSNAYVCPVAGKYSVSAVLASPITSFATTDALQMYLYKNGSQYSVLDWTWGNGVAASVTYYVSGSDSVPCNAGDTLQIYATCSVSAALSTTTGANHVSIEKVGI